MNFVEHVKTPKDMRINISWLCTLFLRLGLDLVNGGEQYMQLSNKLTDISFKIKSDFIACILWILRKVIF